MIDIVVVDDEEDLREPTAAYLADQGLVVREAGGGAELDAVIARQGTPRLIVLDVTMPGEDGFAIARRVRALHGDAIGIIMLTARRDVVDRVVGLELGADDYVMKPFDPRELLARVRAVLRRVEATPVSTGEPEVEDASVAAPDDAFWVPTSRGVVRVPLDTIEWIEAARDYALLHTADRSHMVRVTMSALESRLDPATMMRAHRSAFVQPACVRAISQVGRHVTLVLASGRAVRVGPVHVGDVRARMATLGIV